MLCRTNIVGEASKYNVLASSASESARSSLLFQLGAGHFKFNLTSLVKNSMVWLSVSALLASPLTKLPLLLTSTYLAVTAQSPPNPPPQVEELKKFDGHKDTMLPPVIMRRSILLQTVSHAMLIGLKDLLNAPRLSIGATSYANQWS